MEALEELEAQLQVSDADLVSLTVATCTRPDRFSALVPRLSDTEMRQLDVEGFGLMPTFRRIRRTMMQSDAECERQLADSQLDDFEHHNLLHMEHKLLTAANQWLWAPVQVLAAGHWSLEQSWMKEIEGRARIARRELEAAMRTAQEVNTLIFLVVALIPRFAALTRPRCWEEFCHCRIVGPTALAFQPVLRELLSCACTTTRRSSVASHAYTHYRSYRQ